MLLHKADAWDTAQLLCQFSQYSRIQLSKPLKHDSNNSIYLVAKILQPDHQAAKTALSVWKEEWLRATFGGREEIGDTVAEEEYATVQKLINDFGAELIELARPIWSINTDFHKKNKENTPPDFFLVFSMWDISN